MRTWIIVVRDLVIPRFVTLWVSIASVYVVVGAAGTSAPCEKSPNDFFLYDTEPQARTAGVDYKPTLSAAFGRDESSLVILLQVTAAGVLDGAGAQTHAQVLWSLLKCWGDERFAAVLRSQATNVQNRVLQQLRYETEDDPRVRSLYPRTFEGAAGKTSNLRRAAAARGRRG